MSRSQKLEVSDALKELKSEDSYFMNILHAESFRKGWSAEFFESVLNAPSGLGIGVFDEEHNLIGFCLTRWVIDEAEILTIVVKREDRQCGIGRLLLSRTFELLQTKGVHQVFLEVSEHNSAAIALYRNFGFKSIGVRENYYIDTEETLGNAVVLKLFLNK